jgi:hypothetical protein
LFHFRAVAWGDFGIAVSALASLYRVGIVAVGRSTPRAGELARADFNPIVPTRVRRAVGKFGVEGREAIRGHGKGGRDGHCHVVYSRTKQLIQGDAAHMNDYSTGAWPLQSFNIF